MPLPSLKPTSKSVTLLIIVASVLFVGGVLICFAANSKIATASSELDTKQKQVEDSRKIAQRTANAETVFIQTNAQLQYLETSVSTKSYVPTLLKQLECSGRELKLRVVSVRPSPMEEKKPTRKMSTDSTNPEAADKQMDQNATKAEEKPAVKPYQSFKIDIDVEGNYWNLLSFLYKITTFPKIMSVNSVQLAPTTQTGGISSSNLSLKLNLTAYVFRDEKAVPKPAAGEATITRQLQPDWRQNNEAG